MFAVIDQFEIRKNQKSQFITAWEELTVKSN